MSLVKHTDGEQMGRSGSWSQSHSWAEEVRLSPREPQGQNKYSAHESGHDCPESNWLSISAGATPTAAHLAVTAHKNVLDLIP